MVTNSGRRWMMMLYRVPRRPTAGRVSVWRKLKRVGAILLHDSAWVFPATPRTREQFQWLVAEIVELGGEAMLWEGSLCLDGQDNSLMQQFRDQVDQIYAEIDQALSRPEPDLAALSRRYQQATQQDFFRSELGQCVRARLRETGGAKR